MPPRKKLKTGQPRKRYRRSNKPPAYINRLPFELLSYIFRLVEAEQREEHGPRQPLHWTCAYAFCNVHSYWRSIALGTPDLWTCITVKGKIGLDRAVKWAKLAKNRPLDISMSISPSTCNFETVMDILGEHKDHIEDLSISREYNYRMGRFCWIEGMTSIVCLGLKHVWFDHVGQALTVLGSCPQLQVLSLVRCDVLDLEEGAAYARVCLHLLNVAAFPTCRLTEHLLSHLCLPALEVVALDLDFSCERLIHDMKSGLTWHDPSNPSSRALYNTLQCVGPRWYDGDSFNKIPLYLEALPQLEVLQVHIVPWVAQLLTYLGTPDGEGIFVSPRLRAITIGQCPAEFDLMALEPRFRGLRHLVCELPAALEAVSIVDSGMVDYAAPLNMFRASRTRFRYADSQGTKLSWTP